jgi:hypothetical protein
LDARFGRWMSPDPLFMPWQSPYNSMDGDPINLIDPLGAGTFSDPESGGCIGCSSEGLEEGDEVVDETGTLFSYGGTDINGCDIWFMGGEQALGTVTIGKSAPAPAEEKVEATNADVEDDDWFTVDNFQEGLDYFSMILPGPVAAIVEVAQLSIDLGQGQYEEAAIRAATIVVVAVVGKLAAKGVSSLIKAKRAKNALNSADEAVTGAEKVIGKGDDVVQEVKQATEVVEEVKKVEKKVTKQSNEVVDQGTKKAEEIIKDGSEEIAKKAKPHSLINATKDFLGAKYRFGNVDLLLDKKGLQHVLKRHHPKYWDGSIKKAQSFFKPGMTIGQIEGSIMSVLKQNRKRIISKGNMGMYQIEGVVDGVTYKLGINNGRIGQFYPMN